MGGLSRFSCGGGRERGIISLYAMHSLKNNPKSGYELIKEIKQKTNGLWVPSKGAVYPTLDRLENEGLIKIQKTDERSKKIFMLTDEGQRRLKHIRSHRKTPIDKIHCYRNLFIEVFGGENTRIHELLYDIRETTEQLPPTKKNKAQSLLSECLYSLKQLD